jgi:two-component system phosphate regulon sensor histidine kinase PhoR
VRLFGALLLVGGVVLGSILVVAEPAALLHEGLAAAVVLAIAASALLSELIARTVREPIRDMTEATDALRGGDLSMRVRSRRQDELGALGVAIDQMADQLVERFEAVRREEGRLRTMLDAMVEGVLVTDPEGKIVLTNAALIRRVGPDLEGRTTIEAIRSPELHEAVQQAIRGRSVNVELELVSGGQSRWLTAHVAPLPKDQGVVAVLHDVTELKRADAVRRDFVANASHELRTPLTAIRGFAETLLDGALTDERTAKRFVGNIVENAKRLQSLVDDLLELSRAESPDSAVELVEVDVAHVAALVLQGVEGRAADKRQQLVLEGAGEVILAQGDSRALDQVLLNLVDNAIKYTPEGGRITVRIAQRGEEVVIEVADNGPGIPRAHQDRIFERFYRVDKGRSRAQGGTGLGLAIVRHLVQRMKGRISVESQVGEGSTFRVTLAAA